MANHANVAVESPAYILTSLGFTVWMYQNPMTIVLFNVSDIPMLVLKAVDPA
ncbi:hypothetical protein J6590_062993 [Homalodisca vitripennis]|nr:hypothetical protein J6590_062993 [Homalodisca vitripennis]